MIRLEILDIKRLVIVLTLILMCAPFTAVLAHEEVIESSTQIPIGGTLAPGKGHLYSIGTLDAGSTVTVYITWTPKRQRFT